jgi:hypothetical protein
MYSMPGTCQMQEGLKTPLIFVDLRIHFVRGGGPTLIMSMTAAKMFFLWLLPLSS